MATVRDHQISYGEPPKLKAVRHTVRSRFSEHPSIYLPFARRRYPGPSPEVVGPDTALVIDGYTRSACTFAVHAFQIAQPEPVRVAHHLHAPAQLIAAARRSIPAIVVIREPEGTVLSQVIREPHVSLKGALLAYERFYARLLPYTRAFVSGEFTQVTRDFGSVIRRLNERFGTRFTSFDPTEENLSRCFELVAERATPDVERRALVLGFESGTVTLAELLAAREGAPRTGPEQRVWIPSEERNELKAALLERWNAPRFEALRNRATATYHEFLRRTDAARA